MLENKKEKWGVILQNISTYLKDMKNSFCMASFIGLFLTFFVLFISHGENFSKIFFGDTLDTGMDFFHSINYLKGAAPYERYATLYPPLANLLFYLLYCMVPIKESEKWADNFSMSIKARATEIDLRVHQSTMLLFMLFIIVSTVILFLVVQNYLSKEDKSGRVALGMIFTYGMLYAFERGNIVIISMLCVMIFVFYRNSSDKIIAELSLIILAFGAGLKIYPAIFGFLLLYDRKYKKAFRAILYGIGMFVLPVFVFEEGISGIGLFFKSLLNWGGKTEFSGRGFAFNKIINMIIIVISRITGCNVNEEWLLSVGFMCNLFIVGILLAAGFFLKKNWQRTLVCSLSLVLIRTQGVYILIFMLIPLLQMIKEEKKITIENILPFTALTFSQILLPLSVGNGVITGAYVRIQICILCLVGFIFTDAISEIKPNILKLRNKKQIG